MQRDPVQWLTAAKWTQTEPFVMFLRDLDISDKTTETDEIKIRDGYLSDFRGEGKDILYSIVSSSA